MIRVAILALSLAALTGCAHAQTAAFVSRTAETAILGAGGAEIGRARLDEGPGGVLVRLEFNDGALTPGWHGAHFHERGTCADPGFQASGSHVGHAQGRHGLLNPTGPEPGDLPSIFAPASGAFNVELFSPYVTLAPAWSGRTPILDSDGTALIIHANHDDQISQPIGGAGARVACAVFSAG